MGSPNGDTPLADGNLLVSEINGSWVERVHPAREARLDAFTCRSAIPSDPQQLGPDLYLIADYAAPGPDPRVQPGRARSSTVTTRATGPGMLDHPSLTELLPSGAFMANDDYRNRLVAIDPTTRALVWQ